jgi:replicative DNA helicase
MSSFEKFIPSIEEDELYVLSYIKNNPDSIIHIKQTEFKTKNAKEIYGVLSELIEKKTQTFTPEIIQKYNVNIQKDYIDKLFSTTVVSEDIFKESIKNIKDYKIKLHIGTTVEQFLTQITKKGDLNYDTIRSLSDDILSNALKLTEDNIISDTSVLMDNYRNTIQSRQEGFGKKSFGFSVIDSICVRPAAPGEMSTIVGMKGSGKSLLALCIENALINSRVCVLSINLEMTEESNMDRLISIRKNIPLTDLLDPTEEVMSDIEKGIEDLSKVKNFVYYSDYQMTLAELDTSISKAKQIFKDRGVLPADGYMIVKIDLTEQIEELSGKAGTELKVGVNRLLQLAKKHNIHIINVLQSNENLFRAGKRFSTPEACDSFSIQPEDVEGGSVYAARSRIVFAVNRPLLLKKRFFPERNEEWELENDFLWVNCVKQNDSPNLSRTPFVFGGNSFRIFPYKGD